MAFQIKLYTFSKKRNSTKQPGDAAVTAQGVLKADSGVTSPTVAFNFGLSDNPSAYNYAYIAQFSRYYYIDEWTFSNGLWEASMSVDALASWKSNIGNANLYVLRSSAKHNGIVTDTMYPATTDVSVSSATATNPWATRLPNGTYVVGIINKEAYGEGCVSYYLFGNEEMRQFCNILMGNTSWLDNITYPQGWDETFFKTQFNPFQYVVSCLWLPFFIPQAAVLQNVTYGWWNLPLVAAGMIVQYTEKTFSIDLSKHPQAETRGAYLNAAPFSKLALDFPPFGYIPLDANVYNEASKVYVDFTVDHVTGMGTCWISPTSGRANATNVVSAQIGVPIQLADMSVNALGAASNIISGVAGTVGAAMSGNIGGAIQAGVSGVVSAVNSAMPQMQTSGGNGGFSGFAKAPVLSQWFYKVTEADVDHKGLPCMKNYKVSTHGAGYILAADGDISAPATPSELSDIKTAIEGGFFYE